MAGYTPVYDHMLNGTLFGRWPHTGIWACLLSRASREGVIDEVPASLAAAIGVPVEMLMSCIEDFMKPDPGSRTKAFDGRRLELIDPARDWGWKVLNHAKYREKARKKDYDSERTESGMDANRKRQLRAQDAPSRDVPTRPDASRDVPLSDADAEAYKDKKQTKLAEARSVAGLNLQAFDAWMAYRSDRKPALRPASLVVCAQEMVELGDAAAQMAAVRHSMANSYQGLFAPKVNGAAKSKSSEQTSAVRMFPTFSSYRSLEFLH